jgi:GT2 family glycosyltransferase
MNPTFDIILVSFNRLEYTKDTVGSLIASGAYADCARFIVADNNSTQEGTDAFLTDMAHVGKTFVLRRPRNDGWATAVNDALGLSRAEYVLLINNDVSFMPDFHKEMLKPFESANMPAGVIPVGLVGGWRHTAHGFDTIQTPVFRSMTDVPAVAWMLSKKAMEKVGMLEEHGPCSTKGGNGEDSNYTQRMKGAGFLVGVTPTDVCNHITGY